MTLSKGEEKKQQESELYWDKKWGIMIGQELVKRKVAETWESFQGQVELLLQSRRGKKHGFFLFPTYYSGQTLL